MNVKKIKKNMNVLAKTTPVFSKRVGRVHGTLHFRVEATFTSTLQY